MLYRARLETTVIETWLLPVAHATTERIRPLLKTTSDCSIERAFLAKWIFGKANHVLNDSSLVS